MRMRAFFGRATICVAIGAAMAAAAEGQYFHPYTPGFGSGSYLLPGPYSYYNAPNGYYPNVFRNTTPPPRIGTYLPYQPQPPMPFTIPPTGVVPQPYPFYYQPPLYTPWPHGPAYYPPTVVIPYRYYRYWGPYYP